MKLFKKHSQKNQEEASRAIKELIARNLSKYVKLQHEVNKILVGGHNIHSKKKDCFLLKVDKLIAKMAKYDGKVAELAKTYNLLFDTDVDIEVVTNSVIDKFYPLFREGESNWRAQRVNDDGDEIPDNAPQAIKDAVAKIKKALGKTKEGKGFEVKIKSIDISEAKEKWGLNPEDFASFPQFYDAVMAKEKEEKAFKESGTSGEEFINEKIIHNAEAAATAHVNGEDKKEKLN